MRRSKLEMYIDILRVLAQRGPLKVTHIMYKSNVNCTVLKGCLSALINQGLIEERAGRKGAVVYATTARGANALKFFGELNKAIPILEEDRKIGETPFLRPEFSC
jgi:predicted transcriptional regulator